MDGCGSYPEAVKVSAPKHKVTKAIKGAILCVKVSVATNED
jgi:predicted ATP-grasp superfamily ATP-dependent carboligase